MNSSGGSIQVVDRATGKIFAERVYGEGLLRFAYQSAPGRVLSRGVLASRPLSSLYGAYQSTRWSARKIPRFIEEFQGEFSLDMNEYEAGPYSTFNEFFIRKFKEGARSFCSSGLAAPAEGRYLGWELVTQEQLFPVKGRYLSAEALLGEKSAEWGGVFRDGPLIIARLCPVDYHRFHFPDDGKVLEHYRIAGRYHSVNPIALSVFPDVFATNERQVTILETRTMGRLAYIEVGAMCVGRIVQSHLLEFGSVFKRGDEKGHFLFGGSTVILLGEKGKWAPSEDIVRRTQERVEILVRLGDRISR